MPSDFFDDRLLAGETVSDTRVIKACKTIRVSDGYEIAASGDATLRAGRSTTFEDGVSPKGKMKVVNGAALDV